MSPAAHQHHGQEVIGLGDTAAPSWLTPETIASVRAAEEPPFAPAEYASRLDRVRAAMAAAGLDGLFVFRPSSVDYLCGYHSKETAPQPLFVTHTGTYLHVPDLELGRALACSTADTVLYSAYASARHALETVAAHAAGSVSRGGRIGIEFAHTSTPPLMVELLRTQDVEVVDGDHLVEQVRLVLSPAEIAHVEQAAVATQRGVAAAARAAAHADATDASVGAAITEALYGRATATSAWGPVVATGRRGGIPHSTWGVNPISDGTTFIEFAGAHHRYHAPVMRTLSRGGATPDAERLADLAKTALAAVLAHAAPGVPCSEVADQALKAIGRLPDDVVFHQLFGYPVGLAHPPHWMDGAPFYITAGNPEPLRAGMVFHMPGSFRSFGRSGVGLSQTFVVESTGTRVLTSGAADLIHV
ncbi:Xaa-Pro dipeptidase [Murinocardiopsis flavida]|uniref:Xaa-Pro dipeptidase n=1 Tax=Murinocardiopsis flavida TaxID=645275 RepID=A0A2P8CJ65_9ACTN|nr:Xaa-Pro peptidase family protein [Murinocardiopsis flavida]PSK85008.1 Xaa-Pro dipeptidase [Murinocardiopsis flavida]